MSDVLVTGSEGTLGARLVEELRSRGHSVYGVDLAHSGKPDTMRADVANYRQLERAFIDCLPEYVFHLAAEFGRENGERYYEQIWQANCIGTRNVLELCEEWNSKLIFASSSEVYGEYPLEVEGLIGEQLLRIPTFTNEYAISKFTNELQIKNFVVRHKLPVLTLRFFNAYGPGEHYHPYRSVVCLFVHAALTGQPFNVFEGYHRTFMYSEDFIPTLANAIPERSDKFAYGMTINIGGRDYRSVEDLARIVIEQTGADPALAEMVGQENHNVLNKRPNIEMAEMILGHDPTVTLEEGIPLYVKWMKEVMDHE